MGNGILWILVKINPTRLKKQQPASQEGVACRQFRHAKTNFNYSLFSLQYSLFINQLGCPKRSDLKRYLLL